MNLFPDFGFISLTAYFFIFCSKNKAQNYCKLVAGEILQLIVHYPMLKKILLDLLRKKKHLSELT